MRKKQKTVNDFELSSQLYCKDIANFKPLSREEEIFLIKDYKNNHNVESRNKLINANLKFVINIAKKYTGRGLSYSDLISEGNLGLIKGIERFDETKGYKAITYSVWWIRQSILDAIENRNGVEFDELPYDTENNSTIEDDDILNFNPVNTFADTNADGQFDKNEIMESLETMLSSLNEREREIITRYYGLNEQKQQTLEEIGAEFGLTKERIRQINEKALKKMRSTALINSITSDIYI